MTGVFLINHLPVLFYKSLYLGIGNKRIVSFFVKRKKHSELKKKIIHKGLKFLSILLIAGVGLQMVNRTFFLHSHKDVYGNVITHAHPYNKSADSSPVKKHSHSAFIMFALEQMDLLFLSFVIAKLAIIPAISSKIIHFSHNFVKESWQLSIHGRAPPFS